LFSVNVSSSLSASKRVGIPSVISITCDFTAGWWLIAVIPKPGNQNFVVGTIK